MHAIHDSSIAPENDRIRQISILNEADMFDHPADSGIYGSLVEPVVRVDFAN